MKTSVHLIASLILAAALYPIFSWNVLLILVGGVLIDIDHYFWFVYKYKKFSLFECYRFFTIEAEKNKWKHIKGSLLVFHTMEFLVLIVVLSFFNHLALIFTIGLFGHYLLDLVWHALVPKRIITNHSIISWIIKNKMRIKARIVKEVIEDE